MLHIIRYKGYNEIHFASVKSILFSEKVALNEIFNDIDFDDFVAARDRPNIEKLLSYSTL